MDYIKDLHELCETLSGEIAEVNDKIRAAGGKMSTGDLETLDKLTHALKSVKAVIAMDDEGYSGKYPYYYDRMGRSYARRDSRGRYSGERGYSRNDLLDKMRDLMDEATDDRTRSEMKRLVEKLENA